MTTEQKTLIARWISAWAIGDERSQKESNVALKETGLWAYEAGSGFPTIGSWYNGPIKPGMRFIWDPDGTRQPCRVSRVTNQADEPWVWCINPTGEPDIYNEEEYFRSKVERL